MKKKWIIIIAIVSALCVTSYIVVNIVNKHHVVRELIQFGEIYVNALFFRDKEKMYQVAYGITDGHIVGARGKEFLRLKLSALSHLGYYEEAHYEAVKWFKIFPDDIELLLWKGATGNITNIQTDSFEHALNLLKEYFERKKFLDAIMHDYYIILVNYLQLVLNRNDIDLDRINGLLKGFSEEYLKELLYDFFNNMSERELLRNPPLEGFIYPPFFFIERDQKDMNPPLIYERWWLD